MKWRKLLWFLIVVVTLAPVSLMAQATADPSKGGVVVEVQDTTGAVIVGAQVTLRGPMGELRRTTDSAGRALFSNLIPGTYEVIVEFEGFARYQVSNVVVAAAQRTTVQATLQPRAVTEVVEVVGTAVPIDVTTTTVGTNLASEVYENLPIARNITALFYLAPGVADSGLVGDANPSISGATGLENIYVIDGINITDPGYGGFGIYSAVYGSIGTGVNFDFAKEVQVKTGGFEAQYGQALGGVINIVTKSGSNEFHGEAYLYGEPRWAEGTYKQPNEIRTSSPGTEVHGRKSVDFGLNAGGYLVKDRLFWYGAFNPTFRAIEVMGPPNFATRDLGVLERKRRHYNWVGKLNFNLADGHTLEATGFGDPSRWPEGPNRTLVRDDLENVTSAKFGTWNWAIKYFGSLRPTTLLNVSYAWNHSYFDEVPVVNKFAIRNYGKPKPNAAFTDEGGPGFMGNHDSDNRQFNVMFTHAGDFLGYHTIDLGWQNLDVDYDSIRFYSGPDWPLPEAPGIDPADVGKMVHGGFFYFYPTRRIGGQTYNNVYRLVRGNFSDPAVQTETKYNSLFIQDAWQISDRLTVKLGLRWEQQDLAGNVTDYTFAGNWAPRIGFIIDPTGSRKTKLFAHWGRFFEKIPQDLAVRSMSAEQSYFLGYFFNIDPQPSGVVPGSVFFPSGTEPTIIYGGTKSMYQEEVAAGFERELWQNWVVSARFIHRSLKRGLEDVSGITVEQALAGVHQQYVIANPSSKLDIFHNATPCTEGPDCNVEAGYTFESGELGPDGKPDGFPDMRRVYKALELTFEKRYSERWSLYSSYRLAKLFGNYEGLFRNDNGQDDPNITSLFDFVWSPALKDQFAVGVLPTDRRHIFNLYWSYLTPMNVSVGFGYRVQTGTPISKFLAHPAYVNAGEIPEGGRGAFGRTPTLHDFDLRLAYDINLGEQRKIRLAADLFNLFNLKEVTMVDQNAELSGAVPNEDFLKPLSYQRPFHARFSIRFVF